MNNPKMVRAQKEGKVDYSCIPWRVVPMLAQAMEEGAEKYGRFNYREDPIEARTYIAAICRHLFGDPSTDTLGWVNGEDIDPDSGLPHLIKIMACCLLVEDSRTFGKLIDNRLETKSKKPPIVEECAFEFVDSIDLRGNTTLPTVDIPHTPTAEEVIDMERAPVTHDGAWDVMFTVFADDNTQHSSQRRGPFTSYSEADEYAVSNPENLAGHKSIHTHRGTRNAGNRT